MNARELYQKLERDFVLSCCSDKWWFADYEYITDNFRNRSMGLLTDNTDSIERVYTAVFPSDAVIDKILSDDVRDALLFVHHPLQWDVLKPGFFHAIPRKYLKSLMDRNISIYNLHVPLDRNGAYSTSVNLAKALGIQVVDEFWEYFGVKVAVVGKTECKTIDALMHRFEDAVGHAVRLYQNGDDIIRGGLVAVAAGGGHDKGIYAYLAEQRINTYVTGITRAGDYPPCIEAHETARDNEINILSGTHYSTEKFACIKMVAYFTRLGLPCEFIEDKPCIEDM